MIFPRFKAEFRFPECPIPLNFITIRFLVHLSRRLLGLILTYFLIVC